MCTQERQICICETVFRVLHSRYQMLWAPHFAYQFCLIKDGNTEDPSPDSGAYFADQLVLMLTRLFI